jgi:hypothetical protein
MRAVGGAVAVWQKQQVAQQWRGQLNSGLNSSAVSARRMLPPADWPLLLQPLLACHLTHRRLLPLPAPAGAAVLPHSPAAQPREPGAQCQGAEAGEAAVHGGEASPGSRLAAGAGGRRSWAGGGGAGVSVETVVVVMRHWCCCSNRSHCDCIAIEVKLASGASAALCRRPRPLWQQRRRRAAQGCPWEHLMTGHRG